MDFKRQEGESERAYYHRVLEELKYGTRKEVESLALYQAGKATIKKLEEELVGAFSKKESQKAADPAPAQTPEPAPAPEQDSSPEPAAEVPEAPADPAPEAPAPS